MSICNLSSSTSSISQLLFIIAITISSSWSHDSNSNGPLATKVSASACQSGSSSATLWLTGKKAGLVNKSRKNPVGASKTTSNVLSSTAVIFTSSADPSSLLYSSPPSIKYARKAASDAVSGSSIYFQAYTKSSATTGSPFDQLASSRNCNV